MKKLLQEANERLENAIRGDKDPANVSYAIGYRQAILDAAKRLKEEGLDELEDE